MDVAMSTVCIVPKKHDRRGELLGLVDLHVMTDDCENYQSRPISYRPAITYTTYFYTVYLKWPDFAQIDHSVYTLNCYFILLGNGRHSNRHHF